MAVNPEDELIMMLAPYQEGEDTTDRIGDLMDADCGHRAWVSAASRKMIETTRMKVRTQCMTCTMSDPQAILALLAHGAHVAPGVTEEAADKLGVSQADVKAVMAKFGIKETDDPRSMEDEETLRPFRRE